MALAPAALERIATFVAAEGLLRPREPVVAMVSGGADSTLLLHALCELGHPVEAVHVAHGLRGAASEADARFCEDAARAAGARFTRADAVVADGTNLEGRAREARRAAADAVAAGRRIATGHTRDDRVETILYRLAASPGRGAFAALPPRDGDRVRPLLELSREEVRAILGAAGLAWREDETNADRRFARNRVRHELLPALRSLHPAADQNLLATAAALRDEGEAVAAAARSLLTVDGHALDVPRAADAPPALVRVALRLLAGSPAPPRAGLERAVALCRTSAGTAWVPLDRERVAERRYDRLVVRPAAVPLAPEAVRPAVPGTTAWGAVRVRCRVGAGRAALDPSLGPELLLRPATAGDRLAGHRRSVHRLLADARVARPERASYPVVEAGGAVVCVPGVAVARPHARASGLLFSLEDAWTEMT